MKGRFGVNIVSLFPYSFGKFGGLQTAINIAVQAGFDGLQILPIRGWEYRPQYYEGRSYVVAYEDAWNAGNLHKAILRHMHIVGENFPLFYDWLLFGSWTDVGQRMELFEEFFPKVPFIKHGADPNGKNYVELSPEIFRGQLEKKPTQISSIVLDVEHILRFGRHGESPVTDDWRKLLETLRSEQIKFIHVKPYAHVRKLLSQKEYEKLLMALNEKMSGENCSLIFEARPPILAMLSKRLMIRWLKKERAYLDNFFSRD